MSCKCEMWAPRVWLQLRHGSVKLARGWERSTLLGVGGGLGFFHPLHLQDSSAWKKRKWLTYSIDSKKIGLFLKLIFFFYMIWNTGIASEFHTQILQASHSLRACEWEKKLASLQTFCLTVNVLDYPKIWFVLQSMTNCEWNGTWLQCQDLQCDLKESFCNNNVLFACNVILHDESQNLKAVLFFLHSSHTKLLLFFTFQHWHF